VPRQKVNACYSLAGRELTGSQFAGHKQTSGDGLTILSLFTPRNQATLPVAVVLADHTDWQHSPLRSGATLKVAAQHDNRSGGELDPLLTGDLFAHDRSIGISLTFLIKLLYVVACLRHVRVEVTLRR
jgi:hypothetical protein